VETNTRIGQPPVSESVRTVQLDVRRADGWETVVFEDVESIRVAGAPGDAGVQFTLIGERPDARSHRETRILDIAERHRDLVDSPVPTIDGQAVPMALRDIQEEGDDQQDEETDRV
jgi:hypothetical protein